MQHTNCHLSFSRSYVIHRGSLGAAGILPEDSSFGADYSGDGIKMAALDLGYFVVVVILLPNFIFGILIDTFARLREEREAHEDQVDNHCFVCSKQRGDWATPKLFERHTDSEHNAMDYVFFMAHVSSKSDDDLNGFEQHVRDMMDKNDVDWFPIDMSLSLQDDVAEVDMGTVAEQVRELTGNMEAVTRTLSRMQEAQAEQGAVLVRALAGMANGKVSDKGKGGEA